VPDLEIVSAWRLDNQNIEREAIQFWNSLKILPPGVDPAARAKELVAVAHLNNELAGVATAAIEDVPLVRSRFAMFRCSVAPAHRRSRVGAELMVASKRILEQWSLEHPDEGVKGMGIVLEAQIDRANEPVWPRSGLTLAGFTAQGQQIRLAWFAHARI
jgi:hypothetical protein